MCKKQSLFTILFFSILLIFPVAKIWADSICPSSDNDPCTSKNSAEDKVSCYENISDICSKQIDSLSSQIQTFNSNIALTNLRISQTEAQIDKLVNEIANISTKMDNLENSLTTLSNAFIERIIASYKNSTHNNIGLLLFSSPKLYDFLVNLSYLQIVQKNDRRILLLVEATKVSYGEQKQLREQKKQEQTQLQTRLAIQKNDLVKQQQAKKNLLEATNNNESIYQNLLQKARLELAGFSAFTQSAGGGLTTFGSGSNGWYYTQRDPQWGNVILPGSHSSVLEAGCAVTSVAMVCKSYGQGITPATITSNPNNFIYGDLWNWAFSCSGKTTDWIGTSKDQIKNDVKNNIPVILRLIAPSVSGLHFVVAYAWDDGKSDFKIHDPYYGPDKYFSERYSWSQVTDGIAIH